MGVADDMSRCGRGGVADALRTATPVHIINLIKERTKMHETFQRGDSVSSKVVFFDVFKGYCC